MFCWFSRCVDENGDADFFLSRPHFYYLLCKLLKFLKSNTILLPLEITPGGWNGISWRDFGRKLLVIGYWILDISIVLKVILRNSPAGKKKDFLDYLTKAIWGVHSSRGYINFHPFEKQLKIFFRWKVSLLCTDRWKDGKCRILMNFWAEIFLNFPLSLTLSLVFE